MYKKRFIFGIIGVGLFLRLFLAYIYMGFPSDIACFSAWADRIFSVGPSGFYSPNVFTDYPPGYMYILYIIGFLRNLLNITTYSEIHIVLVKLPSILCDMICCFLLYKEAKEHLTESQTALLVAAYAFNPAVILNSSLWGQVDSVYTLCVVLLCIYLMKGKLFPAYVVFGIGTLIKLQTVIFTPVLLVAILDYVFLKDFNKKKFFTNLFQGLSVILGMVLLCIPFGLQNVISQFTDTLGSYPYASVNAYNFWSLLGMNYASQDNTFLFLSCKTWGTIVILLIVIFTFVIGHYFKNNAAKYPLLAAFIILTMFTFSVRMHERYMYPAMVLLLLYYIHKPKYPTYICYWGFTILHLLNTGHILFYYDPQNYNPAAPIIYLVSAGMLLCMGYFYYHIKHHNVAKEKLPFSLKKAPTASATAISFTKTDVILLLLITGLYSAFALYDLGNAYAPSTTYDMESNDSIYLEFEENQLPTQVSYYIAPWHNRNFSLFTRASAENEWTYLSDISLTNVFTWNSVSLDNISKYVQLSLLENQASLLELTFTDASGNIVLPLNASDYPTLFDESKLYPTDSTFRDSMYFDEIYHARTAYEFINGLTTYENTHPPLGKIFISLGVALFGMNPFGWRIIGTLFGIAMLPFIYLFGKRLTMNTPAAALTCSLFAFDFMHFTQTRIATIDVYITFFIILMYYFMYRYCTMSFYDTPLKRTFVPLGLCGICMGLGVASKWTGVYAGLGLAVLFFMNLFNRYREYKYAKETPHQSTAGISHTKIIQSFVPYTRNTIFFCMMFFVVIPVAIYFLSYIPFVDYYATGYLEKVINNQEQMLSYHGTLVATHPYSSSWYQWPTMIRPIWYYSNVVSESLREGISAFGNPLVWWLGIPAFIHMLYLILRKKDKNAIFLVIGYLSQYLPWMLISRLTFIYHYFPSIPFVVLMIIYSFMQLENKVSKRTLVTIFTLYGLAAFLLFLLFYPVLSGQPVEVEFVAKYLRWMDSWVLIAN